ncbi:MAG: LacI family transcriptional regulator [Solirubrobacteraceae bacterium]
MSESATRGRPGRPTILDVAALSRVSKSTVSNVLRGTGTVSPTTRDRVLAAISALGYRPNVLARNLVQQRTHTLGVVVGDLANTFYAELVKLLEREASDRAYTTIVCNTDGHAEREAARIESLLEHRVGGILLLQFSGDRSIVSQLVVEQVPLVVVSCWDERLDCVAVDDRAGMALAVDHLADLGHQRIGYISGWVVERETDVARHDGYERAMLRRGLTVDADHAVWWDEGEAQRAATDEAVRRVLGAPQPPTAFVASNDYNAIRLLDALERLGARVPQDISVVGFDGIELAGLTRIGLTTVAQPREQMAAVAVGALVEWIEETGEIERLQVRLDPELIVRTSTAPPGGR